MTLKQFLKPDWRKIVIMIILPLIVSILSCESLWDYSESFQNIPSYGHSCSSLDYVVSYLTFIMPIKTARIDPGGLKSEINYLIFTWIVWYLLSCFIIWIYDKFRKRK
jgi:hypothetical protein